MRVLLADDHIMTIEGYKSILKHLDYSYVDILNCEEFHHFISTEKRSIDIAVIDYNMPGYKQAKLESGIDCSVLLKQKYPDCKIIFVTSYEEALVLYGIYKRVRPDALIVKSDFAIDVFKDLIQSKNYDLPYLSKVAQQAVQKVITRDTLLDSKNREILMYLSNGFKVKQIESLVLLSSSAIQKRISKMLADFQVKDYLELVFVARNLDLI
ncbi:response regulator transcription factor [Myroides odoratimimus]|uniref:response regulator n=1 Tax=Myroides odoratimimus TaxID=76832 RepID=UPI0025766CA8|nr:response regulator [Myroides odoratimimus]MDM1412119.1 response regulator transcription factor [Myroides odoratimimus]